MLDSDLTQDKSRQDLDPEVLANLEQKKGEEVARSRSHARIEAKLKVVVRPGNSSEHSRFRLQGVSADLSRGGCRLILPLPVGVGDVFRLEFASTEYDIPLTFARCLRCRLVREQVFEAGFAFFTPIDLPQLGADGADGLPG